MTKKYAMRTVGERLISSRIFKIHIILLLLLFIGILLTEYSALTLNASLSVLPVNHLSGYSLSPASGKLDKGKTIHGKVKSLENNLGAVAVRLHNFNVGNSLDGLHKVQEDSIRFRIREIGRKNWYYEHSYSGGQFHELALFPFGFFPIKDSKNKIYEFEITSLDANNESILTLSGGNPVLETEYQFNKTELIHDRKLLSNFLWKKQVYAVTIFEFYSTMFIYLLPFILCLIWLSPLLAPIRVTTHEKMKGVVTTGQLKDFAPLQKISIYELLVLLGIFVDIIFISDNYQLITFLLLLLWVMRAMIGNFKSDTTFFIAIILLLLSSVFLLFQQQIRAEKTVIWVFFFACMGALQAYFELRKNKK